MISSFIRTPGNIDYIFKLFAIVEAIRRLMGKTKLTAEENNELKDLQEERKRLEREHNRMKKW
ncbi:MAG: hypothetical protein SOY76_00520 [Veillonella caviae]|nr:hypothetical protein [Veillonella caviae]